MIKIKNTWMNKVRYAYWHIVPFDYRPGELWQRFKDWSWNRYSTIKPRTLSHRWCDRRELLLHMSMEILVQFLEKECNSGYVLWYGEEGPKIDNKYVMDEMRNIEYWWTKIFQVSYPEENEHLWKLIETCSPKHVLVPYDDMPDCVAGELKFVYENNEQKTKYKVLVKQERELEERMEKTADEMLQRLAAVRQFMWT